MAFLLYHIESGVTGLKKIFLIYVIVLGILLSGCSGSENEKIPVETKPSDKSGENTAASNGGDLKVFFFEMGKADAFLIYNDMSAILIDTGEKGDGKDILQYMENNNIPSLDYVIITHFDKDHVGGANKVLGNTEVKQVYVSNCPKESEEYNGFMGRIKEKSIPMTVLREDISFDLNGMKVEINAPAKEIYEEDPSNNSSLIVRITYGENEFLFMGDALAERIREYMALQPSPCDVIKMPYHGKFMGCFPELLDMLKPEYAVITSSKEEKEAEETKDLLKLKNIQLYRTRKGGVFMQSNGKDITVFQGA